MIKPELYWLTLTVAFTAVLWVPYVVNRFVELGRPTLKWFPAADPHIGARGARTKGEGWWARQDSNLRPNRYERSALTN